MHKHSLILSIFIALSAKLCEKPPSQPLHVFYLSLFNPRAGGGGTPLKAVHRSGAAKTRFRTPAAAAEDPTRNPPPPISMEHHFALRPFPDIIGIERRPLWLGDGDILQKPPTANGPIIS